MSKDFLVFQSEFKKYQKLFGLTGYKVYFNHEPLENNFAEITIDQVGMVATVRLNSKLPEKDKPHSNIQLSAKHEALHLLLHKLENLARCRYLFQDDIYEATEELVFKLQELLD